MGQPSARTRDAQLRTFLIADIRGYTAYTKERGDEAAGALAGRFAALTRSVVEANDGDLIELRGDEALAVFLSARRALRAAIDLQARIAEDSLPRAAGIGLDAGEAVAVEGGFRGAALNIAARLCAHAGPGQVIASETVVSLAGPVEGITFGEARSYRLKGLEEPVRAVRVVAKEAAGSRSVSRGPSSSPAYLLRKHRTIAAGGVAMIALLLVGAALLGGVPGGGPPTSSPPAGIASSSAVTSAAPPSSPIAIAGPGLFVADASSGSVIGPHVDLKHPVGSQWDGPDLWVFDVQPPALHEIDPLTGRDLMQISIGYDLCGFVAEANILWTIDCAKPELHRIDGSIGRETDVYPLGQGPDDALGGSGLALAAGSLWVARFTADPSGGDVLRVDPATGKVLKRFAYDSSLVAGDDQTIWIEDLFSGKVRTIDPRNDDVGPPFDVPVAYQASIAAGGGSAWLLNLTGGTIAQLSPGAGLVDTLTVKGAVSLSFADGSLWVAGGEAGTVTSVDALTTRTRTLAFGHRVVDVEEQNGRLAVASELGIGDTLAALTGNVLNIVSQATPVYPIDPAIGPGSFWVRQVDAAMCARLLNYPDAPAPDGAKLEPEVATTPEISSDGLTYTFHIRPGYRFSPPSNEAVTAETYRFSIERALNPKWGDAAGGINLLSDVLGAADFHDGKIDHISGITAEGDTLTFRLAAPSGSFLQRLATDFFCPVPLGTTIVEGGVTDPILPTAGPYYMSDKTDDYAILKRNPNYPGPRAPFFDAIAYIMNVAPGDALDQVNQGTADMVAFGLPQSVIDQWGPGSSAAKAGDQRAYVVDGGSDFLSLDPNDPFLKDVNVRRAISFALDRPAISSVTGDIPDSRLLVSRIPGHSDTQFTPADGPDLETARSLMAGRTGTAILAVQADCNVCQSEAAIIQQDLARIGITVKLRQSNDPMGDANAPHSKISMSIGFSTSLLPDAQSIFARVARDFVPQGWLGPDAATGIQGMDLLTGDARISAAQALEQNWLAVEAYIAVLGTWTNSQYFSDRIGCVIATPSQWLPDLVPLCLKPSR